MNNEHDRAVFCVVNRSVSIPTVDRLRACGFQDSEISLVMPHDDGVSDIAVEGHTKAPEGVAAGASGGLLLGGALGWMAGIGTLAIPGLGPFIAAGPLMAALGGAAIGSAAGGITGGLVGMGLTEYEAKQYEAYLTDGKSLISVCVSSSLEVDQAKKVFQEAGGEHISVQSVVSAHR